jgi:hypothetical protein
MAKGSSQPGAPRRAPRRRADDPVAHALVTAQAPSARFRIFIVDSGWNSAARRVLHENFHMIRDLHLDCPVYFLGRERSLELMRRFPNLVGKDPIIRVHCEVAAQQHKPGFHGFRLHLGLLKDEESALQALQNFTKFIAVHRNSMDLEADMRKRLRQEGLVGAFEIVMHGEAHGVSI